MPIKTKRKRSASNPPPRPAEVLDVRGAAALLTVAEDTVYNLFAIGELPGRKVTTKAAVLRRIENTSGDDSLARAVSPARRRLPASRNSFDQV
jgi:hypothetical protein